MGGNDSSFRIPSVMEEGGIQYLELLISCTVLEPGLRFRLTDRCNVVFVAGNR